MINGKECKTIEQAYDDFADAVLELYETVDPEDPHVPYISTDPDDAVANDIILLKENPENVARIQKMTAGVKLVLQQLHELKQGQTNT